MLFFLVMPILYLGEERGRGVGETVSSIPRIVILIESGKLLCRKNFVINSTCLMTFLLFLLKIYCWDQFTGDMAALLEGVGCCLAFLLFLFPLTLGVVSEAAICAAFSAAMKTSSLSSTICSTSSSLFLSSGISLLYQKFPVLDCSI